MSSLAWIDFDAAERARMQRLLALFEEQETRDELGVGSIRDYLSDQFFPGTSTIQTRLRYMLFVPWIFRSLEGRNGSKEQLSNEGRRSELMLIEALKAGGETSGVIGSSAGVSLQRLPSSTYWAGLGHWGIRKFENSIDAYFDALPLLRERRAREAQNGGVTESTSYWHSGLPEPPERFLQTCSFALTSGEADFIVDRLLATRPRSLLAYLADRRDGAEADAIWHHPSLGAFSPAHRDLVHQAKLVSSVLHGASLLYNLLLAEEATAIGNLEKIGDRAKEYREHIASWADRVDIDAIRSWKPEGLFALMAQDGRPVHPILREFFLSWKSAVDASPHGVADDPTARAHVKHREQQLKKSQSRFTNIASLGSWSGESGIRPLSFRWHQAQSHLRDLANAS